MSRQPLPPGEEWIASLLRAEAARHEPDRALILSRLDEELRGPSQRIRTFYRDIRSGRRTRVLNWPVLVAAAAVTVVLGVAGVRAVWVGDQRTAGPAGPGPLPAPATAGNPTLTPSTTTSPQTSLGEAVTPTPSATGHRPSASASSDAGSRQLASGTQVNLHLVQPGTAFHLPAPGYSDWMVVGARQDGTVVHQKSAAPAIQNPLVLGSAAPKAVTGPFVIDWTGGFPEQDRSGDVTWWAVPGNSGYAITVTLPHRNERSIVQLCLGTVDAMALVSAWALPPGSSGPTTPPGNAHANGTPSGAVSVSVGAGENGIVTVTAPDSAAGGTLVVAVQGTPVRGTGQVGLAAVTMR